MGILRGLNHITFAVRDLKQSLTFYCSILGCDLKAKWANGAYITLGDCWICLSLDPESSPATGYSHIAFSIDPKDLPSFTLALSESGIEIWKTNASEGDSVYFLDPDGYKLEAHVGNLRSRLDSIHAQPYDKLRIYSDS